MRLALALLTLPLTAQTAPQLYKQYCAVCHDSPTGRTPPLSTLQSQTPAAIRAALETGIMRQQGAALTPAERETLAKYLGSVPTTTTLNNPCPANTPQPKTTNWSSWSPQPTNTRYQPNPGLTTTEIPKLKLKWSYHLGEGNQARSQPAVHNGRLYIGTQSGTILALDPISRLHPLDLHRRRPNPLWSNRNRQSHLRR